VRELVEAGALPRAAFEEAKLVLAEASDESVLRQTLYGDVALHDLTEDRAEEMLAAAERLVDRQRRELEKAQRLVREEAIPKTALAPYREELRRREETLALAGKRAELFLELVEMVRLEQRLHVALRERPADAGRLAGRFEGSGVFLKSQLGVISLRYVREFGRNLPISASGGTALHRSMGFDHEGRVDVALNPDAPEGMWLTGLLEELQIPYLAFRGAMNGSSTGAHIHIGPPSLRIDSPER